MNALKIGLAVLGSTLVSKGVGYAFDTYAPEGVKNFMGKFDMSSNDVGKVASSFFGATLENPLEMSDLPSVTPVNPVSTAAGRIAGPGKAGPIPIGSSGRIEQLAQRPNVRSALSTIPTIGIPAAKMVSPTLKVGQTAPKKVKIRSIG